jgi:hypothetical protein
MPGWLSRPAAMRASIRPTERGAADKMACMRARACAWAAGKGT